MKKNLIFLCILLSFFVSCVQDVDDIFDKPAAERIEEAIREYEQLLKSNTNGWLVEYYPESGRSYGGFNLYFKFENDEKVLVGSEVDGADMQGSLYSFKADMGPTLNFDTYNSILHYFSDPALNVGGGIGLGYEGDYEFVVISGTSSEFILSGKKTKNRIRMTSLPDGMTWEEYVNEIKKMESDGTASIYTMTVGDKEMLITRAHNVFTITNDGLVFSAPYIFTQTGIKFYDPIEIEGQTLQEFSFDLATDTYNATNANAKITLIFPPLNEVFAETLSQWYFSDMSDELYQLWATANTDAAESPNGIALYNPFIGNSVSSNYPGTVFGMIFSYNGTNYNGLFNVDFTPDNSDQFSIELNYRSTSLNGTITLTYLRPFLNALSDTFTMQANNIKNPTIITFTSKTNAGIWFTVEL